jgi:hypothetical protein
VVGVLELNMEAGTLEKPRNGLLWPVSMTQDARASMKISNLNCGCIIKNALL